MKCQRCDNFWETFECQTLHICKVISCEVNMLNHLLILFRKNKIKIHITQAGYN